MATELLITVHDQSLIGECEANGQFAESPHRWLFVGPRPVDNPDAIVARDHTPNFEHLPSFYDFTGWWAATHHNLITADRVVCLQYDMTINDPDIIKRVDEQLDNPDVGVVAFTAGHRLADNWMLLIPGFRETFEEGMHVLGVEPNDWPMFNEWPSTQGTAWRTEDLCEFMAWVEPLFELWAPNLWAGHLMERTVKAWCVHTGRAEAYLPGVICHYGRDSHGTCAKMGGNEAAYQAKAATFGR